ncbi:2-phosphosulfolactate phosphatase [Candidatus Palauibacter sp.]|uniref:2-phosphosulfolactate phosphatase n=1 Tax=Candidatus Palauibacter sp. TaxID=3101350 RepID=UPI003AF1F399
MAGDAARGGGGVAIVCAGRRGRVSMDDAWCAGHLVTRLVQAVAGATLTDGARAAQALRTELGPPTPAGLACTAAGRALRAIGRADDLRACAAVDDLAVVPVRRDGALVSDRGCQGGEEDV